MHILIADFLKSPTGIDEIAYRYWEKANSFPWYTISSLPVDDLAKTGRYGIRNKKNINLAKCPFNTHKNAIISSSSFASCLVCLDHNSWLNKCDGFLIGQIYIFADFGVVGDLKSEWSQHAILRSQSFWFQLEVGGTAGVMQLRLSHRHHGEQVRDVKKKCLF